MTDVVSRATASCSRSSPVCGTLPLVPAPAAISNLCDVAECTSAPGRRSPTTPPGTTARPGPGPDVHARRRSPSHGHHAPRTASRSSDDLPLDMAVPAGLRRSTGWGAVVYTGEVEAGRHRRRRRHRRDRDQRRAGRGRCAGAENIVAVDPVAVQAGEGAGVRRHPRRRDQRGGLGAPADLTRGRMAKVVRQHQGHRQGRPDRRRRWRLVGKRGKVVVTEPAPGRRRATVAMSAAGAAF